MNNQNVKCTKCNKGKDYQLNMKNTPRDLDIKTAPLEQQKGSLTQSLDVHHLGSQTTPEQCARVTSMIQS